MGVTTHKPIEPEIRGLPLNIELSLKAKLRIILFLLVFFLILYHVGPFWKFETAMWLGVGGLLPQFTACSSLLSGILSFPSLKDLQLLG